MCKVDGCDDDAVGVVLVGRDPIEKVEDHCRTHHVEARRQAGALVQVEVVTNRAPIMGVDGSENRRGAVIELDSEEIHIDQLVKLGFVKRIAATPDEELAQVRERSSALEAQLAQVRDEERRVQQAVAADHTPPVEVEAPAGKSRKAG
jgi:hypothetical protein